MKFLIDESVEYSIVLFLRDQGYDTLSVAESFPSLEDTSILSTAVKEERILITNDKDFGELIFKLKLPHKGVIFLRLTKEDSVSKIKILKILLKKYYHKLSKHFVVVTETKVRFAKEKI